MKDNKGVFYVEYDHNRRSCRVKTHTFNSHRSTDCLVYEERDSAYSIGMHSSKD
jgi:protease II